jgi:hypothetical protein
MEADSPISEPQDLYDLRQAAHKLVDALYDYLEWLDEVLAWEHVSHLHEALSLSDEDAARWGTEHGLEEDIDPRRLVVGLKITAQKRVSKLIKHHEAFEARLKPLTEELAAIYGDCPTISGIQGRSYCIALDNCAFHVVSRTFDTINEATPKSEWDENAGDTQHGFTPSNLYPVLYTLWHDFKDVLDVRINVHELIEREFDHAWNNRIARQPQDPNLQPPPDNAGTETTEPAQPPGVSPPSASQPPGRPSPAEHGGTPDLKPFTGGDMVFHADRVEFCGADICSGPRSMTKAAAGN